MNIAMLSYSDGGGAGNAAVNLMNGINELPGVNCQMYVRHRQRNMSNIISIKSANPFIEYANNKFYEQNVFPGQVQISTMYSGSECEYLNLLSSYDIIHFHWIAKFISPESMQFMEQHGKHLLWTLHDLNPMTGGCHYSYGCIKYMTGCLECPQLRDKKYDKIADLFKVKYKYIPKSTVIVTPSKWLADCARKSYIFRKHRIEVIPYSLNLNTFKQYEKISIRKSLGIPDVKKVILYCAEYPEQIHKGYRYFVEAMRYIAQQIDNVKHTNILLLIVGQSDKVNDSIKNIGFDYKICGYINNEELLAKIYSSADVTVVTSIEDNFPNVVLESLACGTPVAAFQTGGIPDVIDNDKTGYVVTIKDVTALGKAIIKILEQDYWSYNCRKFAEKHLALDVQANRYKELYDDLLKHYIAVYNFKTFSLSEQSKSALGIALSETIDYFLKLSPMQQLQFSHGEFWEEDIIDNFLGTYDINRYNNNTVAIWGVGKFAHKLMKRLLLKYPNGRKQIRGFFDNNDTVNIFYDLPRLQNDILYSIKLLIIGTIDYEEEVYKQICEMKCSNLRVVKLKYLYLKNIIFSEDNSS